MGIARLAELVREEAPDAVSLWPLQQYRGRALALDASIALCQFRSAMPHILNRRGEEISPLQGLFYRTLHLLESGIKPVFVFDGQAPALKQPVLARRAEAAAARRGASDPGTAETQWRRLREDCKTLLGYLGVPCVQAPSEAEATCAALAKSGLVWATATEDMDALAFGSPRLLRHLRVTGSGEVEEISLPHVLQRLDMTPEQVCTGLHWGHGAGCCMDPTASWRRTDACTGDTCTAESAWGSFTTSLCWGGLQQGDGGGLSS
ncbi:flap endonuclease 1 [Alligator mississippiensis]|uniref:flap endonuclease 1 n=1 Tax=Alligator mississippiensis TaxID=8496 RepID=UPI0028772912|nr:flap endonuclease 1 [Alligator mississippiensis]